MEKKIQNLLSELFDLIGIAPKISVLEKDDAFEVGIDETESAGLLIGAHGATLSAIQSFLVIALKQETGEWVKISVDVAGWSEKQNQRLADLAKQTADRVKQTKEEQRLYNLNPMQRRVIHMVLSEDKEIETVSEGEGQDRYLIVRPK